MINNILFIALGAALVGAASFGLYTGFRFLERSAINRRRSGGSLRDLYEDNAEAMKAGDCKNSGCDFIKCRIFSLCGYYDE